MKVGIISDTHGCPTPWTQAFEGFFHDADLIIHAGDVLYHGPRNDIPSDYNPKQLVELMNNCPIPIVIASGNCDAEVDGMVLNTPIQSPYAHILLNGLRILVNHGHLLSDEEKQKLSQQYQATVFISGHTHIPALHIVNSVLYINPGSSAMPKNADKRKTAAILTLNQANIFDIETGQSIITTQLIK